MDKIQKGIAVGVWYCVFAFSTVGAVTHYVDINSATPSYPYTDWTTAATNIQDAVNAAGSNDLVLVADGVYSNGTAATPGFSYLNRVVITNDITVRSVNGPAYASIVGKGPVGSSAVRGVYMSAGVLSGFTVRNGFTPSSASVDHLCGGGVSMYGGSGIVSNCILTANQAVYGGGGSYSGTLIDCTISDSSATQRGGGSYNSTLINCTVTNNLVSFDGGGSYGGTLDNCTLVDNYGTQNGGGCNGAVLNNCLLLDNWANSGGGSYNSTLVSCTLTNNAAKYGGGSRDCTLTNCTLVGNAADYGAGNQGGTLYSCMLAGNVAGMAPGNVAGYGGGSYYGTLTDCTLIDNIAHYGGGCNNSTLSHCTLLGNTADISGGGSANAVLNNCMLSGNEAATYGGGSYGGSLNNCVLSANAAANLGGGSLGSALTNCTIVGNSATNHGGGVHSVTMVNSIVYSNTCGGSGANWYDTTPEISYCCTTPDPGGTGNITNIPLFIAIAGDYHLRPDSPCIDAGTNITGIAADIDGTSRPVDGDNNGSAIFDIGAYEFLDGFITDYDGDGLSNSEEAALGTDQYDADTDDDGMPDGWEVGYGFNPLIDDASLDADGDGLENGYEYDIGSNPQETDSDGDGFDDYFEDNHPRMSPVDNDNDLVSYIQTNTVVFGLYTSNSIMDLTMGNLMLQTTPSNTVYLWLQLEQTTNLVEGVWTNAGDAVWWEGPASEGKAFFRVRGSP